jgi:hypothetical protein
VGLGVGLGGGRFETSLGARGVAETGHGWAGWAARLGRGRGSGGGRGGSAGRLGRGQGRARGGGATRAAGEASQGGEVDFSHCGTTSSRPIDSGLVGARCARLDLAAERLADAEADFCHSGASPYQNIRRECPIHAARTTWLGHSRLIRREARRERYGRDMDQRSRDPLGPQGHQDKPIVRRHKRR